MTLRPPTGPEISPVFPAAKAPAFSLIPAGGPRRPAMGRQPDDTPTTLRENRSVFSDVRIGLMAGTRRSGCSGEPLLKIPKRFRQDIASQRKARLSKHRCRKVTGACRGGAVKDSDRAGFRTGSLLVLYDVCRLSADLPSRRSGIVRDGSRAGSGPLMAARCRRRPDGHRGVQGQRGDRRQ
jgi:hypothetical protein